MKKKLKVLQILGIIFIGLATALASIGGFLVLSVYKDIAVWLCVGSLPVAVAGAVMLLIKE